MTASPLLPIGVLLAGVVVLVLVGLPLRFRATGPLAAGIALLSSLTLFALQGRLPLAAPLSEWRPAALLSSPLSFRIDGLNWIFALALSLLATAALLTGLSRPGGHRTRLRAYVLLIVAAGLTALFASNLLTLCIAWAAFDLVFLVVMLSNVERAHAGEYTVFSVTLNGAATLLLWAVALLIQVDGGSQYLHLAAFTPVQSTLLVLAAVFRLGLYPLHLWLPAEVELRPGLGSMLHIVPATLGLMLLARLALLGDSAMALQRALTLAGTAALLVGALLAWGQDDHRRALSFILLLEVGMAVLMGIWTGPYAPFVLVTEGLVLVMAAGLLFLAHGLDPRAHWASVPSAIAGLAFLGIPGTLGFAGRALLYGAWAQAGQWPLLAVAVVTQAVLGAALVRILLRPPDEAFPQRLPLAAATLAGELLLAVPLVVLGLVPDGLAALLGLDVRPSFADLLGNAAAAVWLTLVLAVAGVLLVYRYDRGLRATRVTARPWLTAVLNLRWLYRLGLRVAGAVTVVVRAMANLLEGEGALLWTLIVLLLAWLFLSPIG